MKEPRYRQIAYTLRARISDGTYPPGAPLPSEETLADEFGVTRPTVRQGLAELRAEGVVTVHMGRGMWVLDPEITALRRERSVAWEMAKREAARADAVEETVRRVLVLAETLSEEGHEEIAARIRELAVE